MKSFNPAKVLFLGMVLCLSFSSLVAKDEVVYYLIPMDEVQHDHLKAYGSVYQSLKKGHTARWLLNYRGGSFVVVSKATSQVDVIRILGHMRVSYERFGPKEYKGILEVVKRSNMAEIVLEKVPKIAVYTPEHSKQSDPVWVTLTYAEIDFDTLYDQEVVEGRLKDYDWIHLHHEDFVRTERGRGGSDVFRLKLKVANLIKAAVEGGLFMFAMCNAGDFLDYALSLDPTDPRDVSKHDDQRTFAFSKPYGAGTNDASDFLLFEYSAKIDPIPTMLNQSHKKRVIGFSGKTSSFRTGLVKDGITTLATTIHGATKYLMGNYGKGSFTYYGGHTPRVGSSAINKVTGRPEIKNSPAYRLILNNVLFPSAKPPPKKT